MDVKDIRRLLDVLSKSDVRELTLETGDYKLNVKRGAEAVSQPGVQAAPTPVAVTALSPTVSADAATGSAAAATPAAAAPPQSTPATDHLVEVVAPIVGTFYAAASPDSPPYVQVGDRVKAGTVMCIIEAMKLMNEIEADVAGVVREVLVENDDPVEYGQVLFRIEPD